MPQPVLLFPFSLLFASDAAHTTGVGKVGGVDGGTNTVETKKRAAADHSNGMDRKDRKGRKGRKKSAERSGGIRERGGAGPTFLVTAGHDGNVCVWNIATRCLISRRTGSWGLELLV